jgi:simple sugar transport system permease protein
MRMMNERLLVVLLAALGLLSLWLAPWGALSRETSARSALLLLPDRVLDFTGRTEPLAVPGQARTLGLSAAALLLILGAALWSDRRRAWLWLLGALLLLGATLYGLAGLQGAVEAARQAASEAGVDARRLPYGRAGAGFAAAFNIALSLAVALLALRLTRLGAAIDRVTASVAVPATSIGLALVVSAAVILVLQPTALGRGVVIAGPLMALAGRIDTVFYAYQTLFAGSLSSVAGLAEALKFTTPLIFTGLAVAFGFRAGLFNIGAPGQMILGAILAMMVGVFMPGPRLLVLPAAVLAAALGGACWGAIPGWLKARFGANEVINTILLNYIAASLLLFILSTDQIFAASALRMVYVVAAFALLALLLNLLPPPRRLFARAPRLALAVGGVLLLALMVGAGLPQAGDRPVNLALPFKAPGTEPKSHPIQPGARIPQLPALLGVDIRQSPGTNVVRVNYALPLALLAAGLAFLGLRASPRFAALGPRAAAAVGAGALSYALAWALGLAARATAVPPSNVNASFLLALLAAVSFYVLLWRTKWGYELRAVGLSPKAAEYGGANVARNVILAMTISGALAGLTASHYVLGGALEEYALRQALPATDGFEGIAVALLGANTPVGVVFAAFLFGVMKNGGASLNITFTDLSRDVVNMILALVVLFIAARGFLPKRLARPRQGGLPPTLEAPVSVEARAPNRAPKEQAEAPGG